MINFEPEEEFIEKCTHVLTTLEGHSVHFALQIVANILNTLLDSIETPEEKTQCLNVVFEILLHLAETQNTKEENEKLQERFLAMASDPPSDKVH